MIENNSLIAEIAGNFKTVQEAIDLAIQSSSNGAESIKLQTYTPELLTSKNAIFDMPNTGKKNQFDVFSESKLDYGMQKEIFKELHRIKIKAFSTPSHPSDVDFLETCDGITRYKIGSDDCSNFELIYVAGQTGKPVIISTGMATLSEVESTVNFCIAKNINFSLMHCTTNYPCSLSQLNLATINTYRNAFAGIQVGYSDHYPGNFSALIAASQGATFFEKHVMLDGIEYGYDSCVSIKTSEIPSYLNQFRELKIALGSSLKCMSKEELINRNNNRKSIHFSRDLSSGDIILKNDLISLRPGHGISPVELENIIGRKIKSNVREGMMVQWSDLE